MAAFLWTVFVLLLIGIVYYGYAKIVVLTILIAGGLFVLAAMTCGLYEWAAKRKPKPPEPNAEFRQDRDKRARAQALLNVCIVPASDAELAELRRLAGL